MIVHILLKIIRWTKGGFGMAAHNYDGDMLTDEVNDLKSTLTNFKSKT